MREIITQQPYITSHFITLYNLIIIDIIYIDVLLSYAPIPAMACRYYSLVHITWPNVALFKLHVRDIC